MVKANSGITSVADLKGKSIGLQNDARQQVQAILSHNKLAPGSVDLVTVGDDPTPFVLGKVDAFTAFAFDEPIALAEKGVKTNCLSYSKIGLPAYGDVYIAQTSTIEKEASMLASFVHAARRGWEYAIKNAHEVVQMTLADYGKDQAPKQQAAQMQVEIPMLQSPETNANGLLWMTTDVWQSSLSFMNQAKLIKKPVAVDDVMTQEILNRAGK
jgi:ABC-type nitrate/sulfonate/bicarbonate transport system substrate-binding protein